VGATEQLTADQNCDGDKSPAKIPETQDKYGLERWTTYRLYNTEIIVRPLPQGDTSCIWTKRDKAENRIASIDPTVRSLQFHIS